MSTTTTSSANGDFPHNRDTTAERAKEFASEAVDQAAEYTQEAQETAVEKLGEIETAIRRNPLQAAAIAAGIGFVFALIARR